MAKSLLLEGLLKNSKTQKGSQELESVLKEDHDGSMLNDLASLLGNETTIQDGIKILGHIFGSSTPQVTSELENKTNLKQGQGKMLLSMLAPFVLEYLGKKHKTHGSGSPDITDLIVKTKKSSKSGSVAEKILTGVLDKDKDGSALDDVLENLADNFLRN